jgi:hypothetical protein
MSEAQLKGLREAYPGVRIQDLTAKQFVGRIATSKVECVRDATNRMAAEGDVVIASDVDMLVKADPFDLFDIPGDVYVTKRPFKWKHPINGGLWAFCMNRPGMKFIAFHDEQVHRKDWEPYRKYLKKFGHLNEVNWRVGQDFLNVIALHDLPFTCEVVQLGSEWNWLHDSGANKKADKAKQAEQDALFEKAKRAYAEAMADPRIVVVHFKAKMKSEMARYTT